MALVHQRLYDSQDLSRLNLKEYIADLVKLFTRNQTACTGQVCFETKLDDVFVLIDTAIPCGLVLSEIISNSLRSCPERDNLQLPAACLPGWQNRHHTHQSWLER
ncbi:MAG: hypothetical protein A3J97_03155 [Spirochaetes bacterium RIFOXYC1_FULL_54_7]|nr:MAG: hypothetical protein A3J97_03155 [Spirochaetes bacterium RIFOXYC1_FULL_54_7]